MILVFCAQSEINDYTDLVADLRDEGQVAALRNARHFTPSDIELQVGKVRVHRVLFTEQALAVQEPYAKAGVATECLDAEVGDPSLPPESEPEELPWLPDG